MEAISALRRLVLTGVVADGVAAQAVADLLALQIQTYPFEPFAWRVWELRSSLSTYDAWYVALAEALETELVTLDGRLARAHGPACRFLVP